jgi:membrane protein
MKHFSLKHVRFFSNEKGVLTQFRLLWAALNKFDDDHGFFLSAGITFNFLICLIPLALLLLALLGTYLYSDREVLDHVRRYLENVIPSLDPTIMKSMLRIMRDRKIVGIFGIAGLIWTSTWVFSSLRTALNIVFQVEKGRSIVRGKAVDLFMIFLAGFFLLMSMTLTSAITIIQGYRFRSFINIGPIIHWVLKYLLPFFFTYWMFLLVYKIVPNKKVSFKPAAQAACFTSILWEVAKQLFGWYVLHIGRFSLVYGSLSAVAVFFLWIYYSSAMLILGGDVAYLLDKDKRD